MTDGVGIALSTHLARLATEEPDRRAVTCAGTSLTRSELDRETNALARAFQERGVRPGSFVTIALPNGLDFVRAALAAWKVGATPQPLSAALPPPERDKLIELADPALVVGVPAGAAGGRASIPGGFVADADDAPLPPMIAPSWKAPASSGSTGAPKLVVSNEPATAEVLLGYAGLFRMRTGGVHLVTAPLHHNAPFLLAAAALFSGNHVVVMPRFDATETLRLVERHGVDWTFVVPTTMRRIIRLPRAERDAFDLSSVRILLHSAEPCPRWLKQQWIDWLGPDRVYEMWSSTEQLAGSMISGTDWLSHRGSVGRLVVGEIQIRDDEGKQLPPGEVGEIWIRTGPQGMVPYRYVGATARTRPGGWQSQGDCGWVDENGYVYLTDRKPDMILVGGANVYPAEVEAALEEHPQVLSCCVIGLPDEEYGNVVHAIVQSDAPLEPEVLRTFLRRRLAPYKVPRSFERVDHPLRDDGGKLSRSRLRAERLAAS
ncbi:MAG TPA: AMP-binding protein [Streptosporangiales bacterium]